MSGAKKAAGGGKGEGKKSDGVLDAILRPKMASEGTAVCGSGRAARGRGRGRGWGAREREKEEGGGKGWIPKLLESAFCLLLFLRLVHP